MSHIAVVFVSYLEVPESRLQEHFEWNRQIYEAHGDDLRVYVVSDVEHDLPDYAETVIFPMEQLPVRDGRPRFSITITKNAGNATAIAHGAKVIICTDVDIAFDREAFERMAAVTDTEAVIPVYRMAESYAGREDGRLDRGCTGTASMTAANWRRIQFDEISVEYGADDGLLLGDIEHADKDDGGAHIEIIRDYAEGGGLITVSHIAHVPGDGARVPGSGASTCWGRASGFNRDNFQQNRKLHNVRVRPVRHRRLRR